MRPAVPAVLRSPLFAFSFPRDRSDTGPDTDPVMTDQRLSIWILAGINLCTMLGLGLVGPILPLYAESFGVSYSTVGLLIALFPIVRLFTNLPSGIWGARYGERRVCTAGASLVALRGIHLRLRTELRLADSGPGPPGNGLLPPCHPTS